MINKYFPEGTLIKTESNKRYIESEQGIRQAIADGAIVEAIAVRCDQDNNIHVDLNGIHGIIDARDSIFLRPTDVFKPIALLKRVGKPVAFRILSLDTNNGKMIAKLSRRAAQEDCYYEYLSRLKAGDIIEAKATHLDRNGAFVDVGCGFSALAPLYRLSVSRIQSAKDRLNKDADIRVVVLGIDYETMRIVVSLKELLGTWEENVSEFQVGQTVIGIIRSVEDYGVFIELAPNLCGLSDVTDDLIPELKQHIGESIAVYIKSVVPEQMKVRLNIIDNEYLQSNVAPLKYYIDESVTHIDAWDFSPDVCSKKVSERFDQV